MTAIATTIAILAGISAIAGVAGAGVSAYGSYQASKAQATAMEFNARRAIQEAQYRQQMSNYNAQVAENKAAGIEQIQVANTARGRRLKAKMLASQTALYGKSGAMGGVGTPLEIEVQQAGEMELDILQDQFVSFEKAKLARAGADVSRMEGELSLLKGKGDAASTRFGIDQVKKAGIIKAGTGLIYGVGSAASSGATAMGAM